MGHCTSCLLCEDENARLSQECTNQRSISQYSCTELSPRKISSDIIKLNSVNEGNKIEIIEYKSVKKLMVKRSLSNINIEENIENKKTETQKFKRNHTRTASLTKGSFLFRAKEKLRRQTVVISLNNRFKEENSSEESTGICGFANNI